MVRVPGDPTTEPVRILWALTPPEIKTLVSKHAPARIADRDQTRPCFLKKPGGGCPGVAEPLDDHPCSFQPIESRYHANGQGIAGTEETAAGGSFATSLGTAHVEWLAGNDREVIPAGVHHGVGVINPGHGARIGVEVRGRDVGVGTDQIT